METIIRIIILAIQACIVLFMSFLTLFFLVHLWDWMGPENQPRAKKLKKLQDQAKSMATQPIPQQEQEVAIMAN